MNWIDEKSAAEKVKRSPRVLRRKVKEGVWNVPFTAVGGRGYQYSEKGINQLLLSFSSVTKS